ncbi:MAG: hypothetical protein IT426_13155 [Pirellulales bacterium]|nr:hypothetical protein [Pirellulales bacterium]
MANDTPNENASAGHKLGQSIGDWFEECFVLPLLQQVAEKLRLYLDHRFRTRKARGEKILWKDEEGNIVDYDFVMELEGSEDEIGIPVAFFECFWRRGSRHSKDKARDDSGKLAPMKLVHPTARFLGIIAAGDFTQPARQLILSRDIDLFYVPKEKVIAAFSALKMQMDYPDRASEAEKQDLAQRFLQSLTEKMRSKAAGKLRNLLGKAAINTYLDRVRAVLGATPQEIRFLARHYSAPRIFATISAASAFLKKPDFDFRNPTETYVYQITYSNGTEFERVVDSLDYLRQLHEQAEKLASHIASL